MRLLMPTPSFGLCSCPVTKRQFGYCLPMQKMNQMIRICGIGDGYLVLAKVLSVSTQGLRSNTVDLEEDLELPLGWLKS